MDEIRIDNLHIRANHGVLEEEKKTGQNFYVNAVLYTDARMAGIKDDLEYSTNYALVCETIKESMTGHTYDLIEAAAEHIAEDILLTYDRIEAVDIELRKPEAPIPMEFESVSVKIHRAWHDVYVAYGSNIGDSQAFIDRAMEGLKEHKHIRFIRESSRIITKPYGGVKQDDFVNGVCYIRTLLMPEELLDYLHELENAAGRTREIHWGPRTLDLDILLYDDMVYESPTLIIPHVDMHNRQFVLEPMNEIAPFVRHPLLGMTMNELFMRGEE